MFSLLAANVLFAADQLAPLPSTSMPTTSPDSPPATGANVPAAIAAAAPTRTKVASTPAVSTNRSGSRVADRVELENTQITGNRELPRVMYVVPWKKPDLGDFGGRPAKSLLDELLQPLDREVFKRQVRYYDALQPDAATGSQPATAASAADGSATSAPSQDEK
jgi:hypothetical protein